MRLARACLIAGVLASVAGIGVAAAQSSRETERKLESLKRELKEVAAERRAIDSKRGAATRELREADERVGDSNSALRTTERELARAREELDALRQRRDAMRATLADRRAELSALLRAAYRQGEAVPLQLLLAQDRVADATRLLTYHRYLQRDHARRIATLAGQLAELDALEQTIVARQHELDSARERQQAQLAQLTRDRKQRASLVARLDERYQDKRSREQALGRDAKGLERLLRKLRAAAARAEAERKAAAEKAARQARERGTPVPKPAAPATPALQVGGLGWPLSGSLLAGYGAAMPDGRKSEGLLIGASAGSPVKAVADGQVVYAEWMTGYGLLLIVDHGNGYMSLYAHNDALLRSPGDRVERGDAVATVGSSGGQGRPALYFELRRDGQPVNPGVWLKRQ